MCTTACAFASRGRIEFSKVGAVARHANQQQTRSHKGRGRPSSAIERLSSSANAWMSHGCSRRFCEQDHPKSQFRRQADALHAPTVADICFASRSLFWAPAPNSASHFVVYGFGGHFSYPVFFAWQHFCFLCARCDSTADVRAFGLMQASGAAHPLGKRPRQNTTGDKSRWI